MNEKWKCKARRRRRVEFTAETWGRGEAPTAALITQAHKSRVDDDGSGGCEGEEEEAGERTSPSVAGCGLNWRGLDEGECN